MAIMASNNLKMMRPNSNDDWEKVKPLFTQLYKEDNRPLPEVMTFLRDRHGFVASEKMYKNKIRSWNLRKYLKEDEAKQILESAKAAASTNGVIHSNGEAAEIEERAARSLKRKRARQRAQTNTSPQATTSTTMSPSPQPASPSTSAMVPFVPPAAMSPVAPLDGFQITDIGEQFLLSLRNWTHNAFVHGHWDTQSTAQLRRGRQASRVLSSSLNSGINLYQNGKPELAWKEWNRAFAGFSNPELFKSWYYEIPLALLFEVSRVANSGHGPLGQKLLQNVNTWANQYLEPTDSRHALFTLFGNLEVGQLRDLYGRAAKSMIDGLETRIEKGNKLLYEVRLNRALDMLWYDSDADLSAFLPPVSEVDEAMGGPNNALSVYFLLLQAYRLVAQDRYEEADLICAQVQSRLNIMNEVKGSIDWWRVGLAYRRLGRQQHSKGRYVEARRSFNTALKYVSSDSQLSRSVLIEICQRQQSMARAMNDQGDVYLWTQMLEGLEQQTSKAQVVEISDEPEEMDEAEKKRVRITPPARTESPGPTRRATTTF